MEFKIFTNLIDALGKVLGGIKAVANLPKAEREKYRSTMDETYRLIDTTLNMIIIRMGDALQMDDSKFIDEVVKLDNYDDWLRAEREFRLCKSLRVAVRETESLAAQLAGRVSANDWDALVKQMQSVLATEGEVAVFISERFHQLAESARNAAEPVDVTRQQVTTFRNSLSAERQALIQQEVELYKLA